MGSYTDHIKKTFTQDLELKNSNLQHELSAALEENKSLKSKLNEYENLLIAIKTEREVLERTRQKTWEEKVIEFTGALPFKIGIILRFLLTPPVSRYFFMLLFALTFVASLIGWDGVAKALDPIIGMFKQ